MLYQELFLLPRGRFIVKTTRLDDLAVGVELVLGMHKHRPLVMNRTMQVICV